MPEIVWIATTCLHRDKATLHWPEGFTSYEQREQDYKRGIPSVLKYRLPNERVFITENTGPKRSFLDDFGAVVMYTNTQQTMGADHKGRKEIVDIQCCLHVHAIPDDTMVIKTTGRYYLNSDTFPNLVRNNPDKEAVYSPTSAFKSEPPHPFPDCILGMIAMKAKHWKRIPLEKIVPEVSCEWIVARYIVDNIPRDKRLEIETLDLSVKIGNSPFYWTV